MTKFFKLYVVGVESVADFKSNMYKGVPSSSAGSDKSVPLVQARDSESRKVSIPQGNFKGKVGKFLLGYQEDTSEEEVNFEEALEAYKQKYNKKRCPPNFRRLFSELFPGVNVNTKSKSKKSLQSSKVSGVPTEPKESKYTDLVDAVVAQQNPGVISTPPQEESKEVVADDTKEESGVSEHQEKAPKAKKTSKRKKKMGKIETWFHNLNVEDGENTDIETMRNRYKEETGAKRIHHTFKKFHEEYFPQHYTFDEEDVVRSQDEEVKVSNENNNVVEYDPEHPINTIVVEEEPPKRMKKKKLAKKGKIEQWYDALDKDNIEDTSFSALCARYMEEKGVKRIHCTFKAQYKKHFPDGIIEEKPKKVKKAKKVRFQRAKLIKSPPTEEPQKELKQITVEECDKVSVKEEEMPRYRFGYDKEIASILTGNTVIEKNIDPNVMDRFAGKACKHIKKLQLEDMLHEVDGDITALTHRIMTETSIKDDAVDKVLRRCDYEMNDYEMNVFMLVCVEATLVKLGIKYNIPTFEESNEEAKQFVELRKQYRKKRKLAPKNPPVFDEAPPLPDNLDTTVDEEFGEVVEEVKHSRRNSIVIEPQLPSQEEDDVVEEMEAAADIAPVEDHTHDKKEDDDDMPPPMLRLERAVAQEEDSQVSTEEDVEEPPAKVEEMKGELCANCLVDEVEEDGDYLCENCKGELGELVGEHRSPFYSLLVRPTCDAPKCGRERNRGIYCSVHFKYFHSQAVVNHEVRPYRGEFREESPSLYFDDATDIIGETELGRMLPTDLLRILVNYHVWGTRADRAYEMRLEMDRMKKLKSCYKFHHVPINHDLAEHFLRQRFRIPADLRMQTSKYTAFFRLPNGGKIVLDRGSPSLHWNKPNGLTWPQAAKKRGKIVRVALLNKRRSIYKPDKKHRDVTLYCCNTDRFTWNKVDKDLRDVAEYNSHLEEKAIEEERQRVLAEEANESSDESEVDIEDMMSDYGIGEDEEEIKFNNDVEVVVPQLPGNEAPLVEDNFGDNDFKFNDEVKQVEMDVAWQDEVVQDLEMCYIIVKKQEDEFAMDKCKDCGFWLVNGECSMCSSKVKEASIIGEGEVNISFFDNYQAQPDVQEEKPKEECAHIGLQQYNADGSKVTNNCMLCNKVLTDGRLICECLDTYKEESISSFENHMSDWSNQAECYEHSSQCSCKYCNAAFIEDKDDTPPLPEEKMVNVSKLVDGKFVTVQVPDKEFFGCDCSGSECSCSVDFGSDNDTDYNEEGEVSCPFSDCTRFCKEGYMTCARHSSVKQLLKKSYEAVDYEYEPNSKEMEEAAREVLNGFPSMILKAQAEIAPVEDHTFTDADTSDDDDEPPCSMLQVVRYSAPIRKEKARFVSCNVQDEKYMSCMPPDEIDYEVRRLWSSLTSYMISVFDNKTHLWGDDLGKDRKKAMNIYRRYLGCAKHTLKFMYNSFDWEHVQVARTVAYNEAICQNVLYQLEPSSWPIDGSCVICRLHEDECQCFCPICGNEHCTCFNCMTCLNVGDRCKCTPLCNYCGLEQSCCDCEMKCDGCGEMNMNCKCVPMCAACAYELDKCVCDAGSESDVSMFNENNDCVREGEDYMDPQIADMVNDQPEGYESDSSEDEPLIMPRKVEVVMDTVTQCEGVIFDCVKEVEIDTVVECEGVIMDCVKTHTVLDIVKPADVVVMDCVKEFNAIQRCKYFCCFDDGLPNEPYCELHKCIVEADKLNEELMKMPPLKHKPSKIKSKRKKKKISKEEEELKEFLSQPLEVIYAELFGEVNEDNFTPWYPGYSIDPITGYDYESSIGSSSNSGNVIGFESFLEQELENELNELMDLSDVERESGDEEDCKMEILPEVITDDGAEEAKMLEEMEEQRRIAMRAALLKDVVTKANSRSWDTSRLYGLDKVWRDFAMTITKKWYAVQKKKFVGNRQLLKVVDHETLEYDPVMGSKIVLPPTNGYEMYSYENCALENGGQCSLLDFEDFQDYYRRKEEKSNTCLGVLYNMAYEEYNDYEVPEDAPYAIYSYDMQPEDLEKIIPIEEVWSPRNSSKLAPMSPCMADTMEDFKLDPIVEEEDYSTSDLLEDIQWMPCVNDGPSVVGPLESNDFDREYMEETKRPFKYLKYQKKNKNKGKKKVWILPRKNNEDVKEKSPKERVEEEMKKPKRKRKRNKKKKTKLNFRKEYKIDTIKEEDCNVTTTCNLNDVPKLHKRKIQPNGPKHNKDYLPLPKYMPKPPTEEEILAKLDTPLREAAGFPPKEKEEAKVCIEKDVILTPPVIMMDCIKEYKAPAPKVIEAEAEVPFEDDFDFDEPDEFDLQVFEDIPQDMIEEDVPEWVLEANEADGISNEVTEIPTVDVLKNNNEIPTIDVNCIPKPKDDIFASLGINLNDITLGDNIDLNVNPYEDTKEDNEVPEWIDNNVSSINKENVIPTIDVLSINKPYLSNDNKKPVTKKVQPASFISMIESRKCVTQEQCFSVGAKPRSKIAKPLDPNFRHRRKQVKLSEGFLKTTVVPENNIDVEVVTGPPSNEMIEAKEAMEVEEDYLHDNNLEFKFEKPIKEKPSDTILDEDGNVVGTRATGVIEKKELCPNFVHVEGMSINCEPVFVAPKPKIVPEADKYKVKHKFGFNRPVVMQWLNDMKIQNEELLEQDCLNMFLQEFDLQEGPKQWHKWFTSVFKVYTLADALRKN